MSAIAKVPRPLSKLTPMIRRELKAGFQAGERHWRKVGRLLNEARHHFPKSGPNKNGLTFHQWVAKTFQHPWTGEKLEAQTVRRWMRAARKSLASAGNGSVRSRPEPSLTSVTDSRSPQHEDYEPKLDWQKNVREVQQTIDPDRLAQQFKDEKREAKERAALARKIVDAGYRALAVIVHPDKKGGSKEAMAKLTKARKWLDEQIRRNS